MKKIDLTANPFFLDKSEIKKIDEIKQRMTFDEKIGQLFCLEGDFNSEEEVKNIINNFHPGAMMYRPQDSEKIQSTQKIIQNVSPIPLLLAANLESGGDGIGTDGTFYGRQLEVAASNNTQNAYRLGKISAREGMAVGCNWSFAPVVDFNKNFANPIINVRTYGDNPETVIDMASQYIKACQEEGMAVSIKHFPGDGVDDRDQHLLTSVNSLSTEEWDQTYGKIYKSMIDQGALTLMAGHIYQPSYTKKFNPEIKDKDIYPGSLSPELLQGLLRGQLNYNGLICTDASTMAGFECQGERKDLLPQSINAGCDMILFTRNLDEDYQSVYNAVKSGVISSDRIDEALSRILATKMRLNLFDKKNNGTLVPDKDSLKILQCNEHVQWAKELAEESVTLVKNNQNILPLTPDKNKNILVIVIGDEVSASGKPPVHNLFVDSLKKEGFNVSVLDPNDEKMKKAMTKGAVSDLKSKFDTVIYFANVKTASNQTTVRLNWLKPMGYNSPWFLNDIPTIFISIANPYHLQDVPMVKTYINAYTANEYVPPIVVEKLVGKSPFKGISPIDPFCGYWDTKL
ncbi:glycoside hydrolase family 3 protein [Xylocopilactobacillus apis]|uniref:beta-N-acetylhexosaminidase n=1 Tax=Xylocopilactobacillus apis TaxID=2932183 RepID=A0AAU9D564_9LACO|nr:glycoside hydrolase family 3 N-terminal domain-containing protein [Xylocopilactobacillus apis]BDR56560.1 beta-hexosaminidase [Xylocopilactobacillus apis]